MLCAIAVVGLAAIPLHYSVLKRLLAIVETVRAGEPFAAANASRLQAIAWALLALQLLSLVIGAIGKSVSTPAHPLDLDAGFSINGWLAVLLTFLLARVFAEGALMRGDLSCQPGDLLRFEPEQAERELCSRSSSRHFTWRTTSSAG